MSEEEQKNKFADQFMEEIWTLNPVLRGCPVISESIRARFLSDAWDPMHLAKEAVALVPAKETERLEVLHEVCAEMHHLLTHSYAILSGNPSPEVQGLAARIEEFLEA